MLSVLSRSCRRSACAAWRHLLPLSRVSRVFEPIQSKENLLDAAVDLGQQRLQSAHPHSHGRELILHCRR
jgi:hypothetical protein